MSSPYDLRYLMRFATRTQPNRIGMTMKPFLKPSFFITISAVAGLALSACSEKSQEQLIVGDWTQAKAITVEEGGASITMKDGLITYSQDGTSKGTMSMTLKDLPEDIGNYKILTTGNWRIEDGILVEGLDDASVSNPANTPQGNDIAKQIEAGMEGQPEGRSAIKELTKSSLVIYQEETGLSLSFTR